MPNRAVHAAPAAAPREGTWRGDILGSLNATAALLPFVLSYGFIAFGALGPAAAQVGFTATVIAVVLGGAAMALLGGSRLPAASPSASVCLVVGSAVATLARDPALAAESPAGLALVVGCAGGIAVAAGLFTVALGAAKAGSLVRFVPQPVLAGLMNGVAVLIVLSQLPPLLGLPADALARGGLQALSAWNGPALLVALATAALMAFAARRWPSAPAALLALAVAGFAVWGWQWLAAPGSPGATFAPVGPLAAAPPRLDSLAPLVDAAAWPLLSRHLPMLGLAALLVALIGALESVLNLAAVQQELDEPADPDRELLAAGAASVVSGLFGGLPVVYLRTRALATWTGGGRGPRALWLGCGLLALVVLFGLPLIEPLPTAVIAGVVIVLAAKLVDRWTCGLVRRWLGRRDAGQPELRASLGIAVLVAGVTVLWGVAAGTGCGVTVSVVIFMRTLHRQLVHARYTAAEFPSRRVYPSADEAVLATLRGGIRIVELEGALFFGSAERLTVEAERPPAGTTDLVFDLRRLTIVDASGALALAQAGSRLALQGIVLRLAGVRPGDRHHRVLRSHGVALVSADADAADGGTLRIHPDVDRAVEAAERCALGRAGSGAGTGTIALADCQLLDGLTPAQLERLLPRFAEQRLRSGERLFAQGDAGRSLYLLTEGAISVVDAGSGQRFATLVPGMCFGETATLDGAPRSADAVADADSVVHALAQDALQALQHAEPAIAAQLYLNLARHLSERLRSASAGWRRAAR